MGRLDWKRGRFRSDTYETQEIHRALRGFQNTEVYDEISYYRFARPTSQMHDVYDEGTGGGKVYHPPVVIPCLHVTHNEGGNADTDSGFYYNDDIYVSASFDQIYRTGLVLADVQHNRYLKDRLAYNGKLFRVSQMHVLGQISAGRDIVVSMEGTQVKPDELVNDPQFLDFQNARSEQNDSDLP